MAENPMIESLFAELPRFEEIQPQDIPPALEEILGGNRRRLKELGHVANPCWQTIMQPLEEMEERLQRLWSPVNHINAVCDSAELRPVYQEGLQELTAYETDLAQNDAVFSAIKTIRDAPSFASLSQEQQQVIKHALRDFHLNGADLPPAEKPRFKQMRMRLSELGAKFEQNLLDATRAFTLLIEDEQGLAGLPQSVRDAAAERAREAMESGWLFTLDAPSYLPFMLHAQNREFRRKMYTAYVTRAIDGKLDNSPLIIEILRIRGEAARMLGFANYGEYSLASKMAGNPREVTDFLRQLAARSRSVAEDEFSDLKAFASDQLGLARLEAWDVAFASERLRQYRFDFNQEEMKPYFPEGQVIRGLFAVVKQLYDLRISERPDVPRWHESVRYFDIRDTGGAIIAGFYLDAYARSHKRGGAWMDECRIRWRQTDGKLQIPVAYLVCNFEAPVGKAPALWTHEEVITLFHEFGHGLHHMLTEVETLGVSGIRGVPWDAVEFPSQFMENFCWQRRALALFARHYQTKEPLPDMLFEKMQSVKTFHGGMQMLRQIELALFDFLLHTDYDPDGDQSVQDVLNRVRKEVAVLIPPAFNKFQNSFTHIFASGYAAGYYSYKWAEVLSADAFAAFEEAGIFDPETASAMRDKLLAVGGSRDIMTSYRDFRGRGPTVGALLRQSGIISDEGKQ